MKLPNLPLGASLVLAAVALFAVAGIVGYATSSDSAASSRFEAGEPATSPYLRGTVQSLTADTISLTTERGPVTLKLGTSAPVEALRPVAPSTLAAGDWLNGGAVGHKQTVFALTGLVAIAPAQQGAVPK